MCKKLSIFCLVLAVVAALSVPTSAKPFYTPFLKVDLNGDNLDANQLPKEANRTQPGWSGWDFQRSLTTNTYVKSFGSQTVQISGILASGAMPGTRYRLQAPTTALGKLHEDMFFVSTSASSKALLGLDYLRVDVVGLQKNTKYEFTVWNWDTAFNPNNDPCRPRQSDRMAWGVVNPATYGGYRVVDDPCGGYGVYKNPVPILARPDYYGAPGPWEANFPYWNTAPVNGGSIPDPEYYYSSSFIVTSNASGQISVFGWTDTYTWQGSYHATINGFALGLVPEPATVALLGLGGLAMLRRRKRA